MLCSYIYNMQDLQSKVKSLYIKAFLPTTMILALVGSYIADKHIDKRREQLEPYYDAVQKYVSFGDSVGQCDISALSESDFNEIFQREEYLRKQVESAYESIKNPPQKQ